MIEYKVKVYKDKTEWFNLQNQFHRVDGPAVEYSNGDKEWYLNGKLHRIDGPAIEYFHGTKCWYLNGKFHRIDGPAVEWSDGQKEYYLNGTGYSEKQYWEEIKSSQSCDGKIVEIDGKKYKLQEISRNLRKNFFSSCF